MSAESSRALVTFGGLGEVGRPREAGERARDHFGSVALWWPHAGASVGRSKLQRFRAWKEN